MLRCPFHEIITTMLLALTTLASESNVIVCNLVQLTVFRNQLESNVLFALSGHLVLKEQLH
jgi:hypothetical protein